MACAVLATLAWQLVGPITGWERITASQAWGIILYMTPLAVNRFNATALFCTLLPDMKRPRELRREPRKGNLSVQR